MGLFNNTSISHEIQHLERGDLGRRLYSAVGHTLPSSIHLPHRRGSGFPVRGKKITKFTYVSYANSCGTVDSSFHCRFSANVWVTPAHWKVNPGGSAIRFGLLGIFEHRFSELVMPVLVQHHGMPLYISRHTTQCQNQQFPGWWVGRRRQQNWAPRLLDFKRPVFKVWAYVKCLIYGHNVDALICCVCISERDTAPHYSFF